MTAMIWGDLQKVIGIRSGVRSVSGIHVPDEVHCYADGRAVAKFIDPPQGDLIFDSLSDLEAFFELDVAAATDYVITAEHGASLQ